MPRRNHKNDRKQVRHQPNIGSANQESEQPRSARQPAQVNGNPKKRKGTSK